MAREEVKELSPITQAFVKGKTIQDWIKDTWKDKEYTLFGKLSRSPLKPDSDTDLSGPENSTGQRYQSTNYLGDKQSVGKM